jgi:hypothetical protein
MMSARRQEAGRRHRRNIDQPTSDPEVEAATSDPEVDAAASDPEVEQANLSAYGLAAIGFLAMAGLSVEARNPIAAFGLTFQTATVLLVSPELLRPLGRLGYLRRRAETIRARRRRIAVVGAVDAVIATVVVVIRHLLGGADADESLPWALALVLALFGYLVAAGLFAWWVVEMWLEGAADREVRTTLGGLDAERVRDVRWTVAAAMFAFGSLLLYVGAYG